MNFDVGRVKNNEMQVLKMFEILNPYDIPIWLFSKNHHVNQKSALEVALCTGGPTTVEVMEFYMRIPEIIFVEIENMNDIYNFFQS